ncbi:helix-turn-helix transcriptional regulator [Paenibacillus soyae]|uniref:AraC family transcriptional regulator n=1 Tax=Paenibacillus soyae TaxID=2969249 RepID=A0A9X2S7W0_9BACL|nr:AraC family transcriptional regulator [Paenibacillus soyae]MCR2803749.1 AraC family transcriptional regulator [Paenibacillus soyae]
MSDSPSFIYFAAPPLPYFLESGETLYEAGDRHPSRQHLGMFDWLIVESGCLHIGEEEAQWSLSGGQSLILLPDNYHYAIQSCTERTRFYWIHFQAVGEWLQSEQAHGTLDQESHAARFKTTPYSLTLRKQWTLPYPEQAYQLARKLNRSGGERQSNAFWSRQQTFEELLRIMDLRQNDLYASPVVTLAEKAETFLKAHYRSQVTSQMMTEALNFHYNYITRCMKQVYGMTPSEYLTAYRIEQAKLLLLKTEWPIAVVAEQVGYESAPYFTYSFSKKAGISPAKFRKQYMK